MRGPSYRDWGHGPLQWARATVTRNFKLKSGGLPLAAVPGPESLRRRRADSEPLEG
jgi:hypothetical protein